MKKEKEPELIIYTEEEQYWKGIENECDMQIKSAEGIIKLNIEIKKICDIKIKEEKIKREGESKFKKLTGKIFNSPKDKK